VVTMEGHVAAADGRRWLNDERVSGLGMGGSGDVLAGLVAGGAAQHADVAWATCRATYLHLAAGKAAAARIGPIGYLARELLEPIPRILCDITTIVGS
jgi:ADP-dependent NAD(P)H-hydrate dehydratase